MPDAYAAGYIANGPIDIDGVRAFNALDPVPDNHVAKGIVSQDQVAKGAAAKKIQADPPDATSS